VPALSEANGGIKGDFKPPTGASKRGADPSFYFLPLSVDGEGDTGGEVKMLVPFLLLEYTG
jgi:hypothetical protein